MELWLFVLAALVISITIVLMTKRDPKQEKSSQENKVLLKQLLEGFGLEVPAELKELEQAVMKSIKSP